MASGGNVSSTGTFTADYRERPWWWEAVDPADNPAHPLPDSTDVLIVGSGYAGLNAALELARGGVRATVVDASPIGHGASTRNGGMLSTEPKFAPREQLVERYGEALADQIVDDGRAALPSLEEVVEREAIDCHLERNGRFVGAHARRAFRTMAASFRALPESEQARFELVERIDQHVYVGDSDYYHGGLFEPAGGALDPALYHRGLISACERQGVILCGSAPVDGITRAADDFRVRIGDHTVRAGQVMLATNGYTGPLSPWQRARLVPLGSYIIATEDIGEERVESLFRGFATHANTQRVLYYYRPSPDHQRILFGGRASFGPTSPTEAAPRLLGYLRGVWPSLADVRVSRAWTGNVAFTFDHLPHMGQHEGIHYCMGCNGSGVAMMSYLGRQVALAILGPRKRACAFARIPFPTVPGYDGRPWFLPLVGNWYRLRDRLDRLLP